MVLSLMPAWFAFTVEKLNTFPLECLEGSVGHSSVIFVRWHHVMTQKHVQTCIELVSLSWPWGRDTMCSEQQESPSSQISNIPASVSDVCSLQRGVCASCGFAPKSLHPRFTLAWSCCIRLSLFRGIQGFQCSLQLDIAQSAEITDP